ncbi:MAG: PAS domain-containing protein [Planctomycetes bacterium]|nr:PAS domain-containing protein [Planctomycetota bacterium]
MPDWVHTLDTAVWVSGSDGNITFLNRQAEELLGLSASECVGLPCHRVVGGVDVAGESFCVAECPVTCQARASGKVTPVKFRIPGRDGRDRSVRVITMMVGAPVGASLVHCAVSDDTAQRAEEYVTRLASRTACSSNGAEALLTPREKEVLVRLAEDETTHEIAAGLNVSHATVRNHIQRIVAKYGAHSTVEAVARYLLSEP